MKDWSTKVDNDTSTKGIEYPNDINSNYMEKKEVVSTAMTLNESDNQQFIKSIDTISKMKMYVDVGVVNALKLRRDGLSQAIETYSDCMTVFFSPKVNNTGSTTIQLQGLPVVPAKFNGADLEADFLKVSYLYMGIYNPNDNVFEVYQIAIGGTDSSTSSGDPTVRFQVADGVDGKDAINLEQLNTYLDGTNIVDNLTSTATNQTLSAKQGKTLSDLITLINIASNDANLDTMQELVTYIKANRNILLSLNIASVDGLQTALDGKADTTHIHDDLYYGKAVIDTNLNTKANLHGSSTVKFKVANGTDPKDAVNVSQLNLLGTVDSWDYTETTDPLITTNPTKDSALWKNTVSGEFFVCTDKTVDANHWVGTAGTRVRPSTVSVVDIFGDNSAIGLYELEDNANDTGGTNNLTASGSFTYSADAKYGNKSAYFKNTTGNLAIAGTNVRAISLWYKFDSYSDNDNCIITGSGGDSNLSLILRTDGTRTLFTNNKTVYVNGVETTTMPDNGEYNHYVLLTDVDTPNLDYGNKDSDVNTINSAGGYIDQVRTFNRALTADEINQLMNEQ